MKDLDKYRGCLIGSAAGDALGFPVEFFGEGEIFQKYGYSGITSYDLSEGVAQISDDTQMTLFTANCLLSTMTWKRAGHYFEPWSEYARKSYSDWYLTQTKEYSVDYDEKWSWLLNIPELFNSRAPGTTCLYALPNNTGTIDNPCNNSMGCGGIMRVAPVGLYLGGLNYSEEERDRIGAEFAAVTHGHEMGYIPAATLTHIIKRVAHNGESIEQAVHSAIIATEKIFPDSALLPGFFYHLKKAMSLAKEDLDDLDAIHVLGKGWVADETLTIAVYCAVKYQDDFEKAIIAAVNHRGDSDSTGAVTGAIVGAHVGLSGIPNKFKERLELYKVILELADDLYHDRVIAGYDYYNSPDPEDVLWECKYALGCYPLIKDVSEFWRAREEQRSKDNM